MKRFALLAASVMTLAACSDGFDASSVAGPQNTIQLTGNVSTCGAIDLVSCFAVLDNEFKVLYELNNTLSRRGESAYRAASASNYELSVIFQTPTTTVAQAITQIDKFIAQVSRSYSQGDYSQCAADQILASANWIRALLVAGSVDVSNRPAAGCQVTPVIPSAAGSASAGVMLTINDPWNYQGDIAYNRPFNETYFIVERSIDGGAFMPFLTTVPTQQAGAVTFTISDPAANQIGVTYTYRVTQCSLWPSLDCSVGATASVMITAVSQLCVHDNRDGLWVDNKTKPKCPLVKNN